MTASCAARRAETYWLFLVNFPDAGFGKHPESLQILSLRSGQAFHNPTTCGDAKLATTAKEMTIDSNDEIAENDATPFCLQKV